MTASWTDTTDDVLRICLDCSRNTVKVIGRGLCARCYKRRRVAGSLDERPPQVFSLERVHAWLEVVRGTDDCWRWPGAKMHGYGLVHIDGTATLTHRLVWTLLVGPIPEGMWIDHQCHNRDLHCNAGSRCRHRACCNPAHLEVVPRRENSRRGRGPAAVNLAKTHCPQGHPYDGDNLYTVPRTGARMCRTCARDRRRAGRAL